MRALSIRQPYAELILRGLKTIEFRTRATKIIGERFYIYAAKTWATGGSSATDAKPKIWSTDLTVPGRDENSTPPPWMLTLADRLILRGPDGGDLPTGVIVGTAVIERVTQGPTSYEWHLGDVQRATRLRKPTGHPQPVWFTPF
ncbi:MAG TPA: ASCH domain-containing protein [Tepidisphaeraceae bacterium]|nr:ASCH domain-containing protein [Tepidisphaeraceae bacterium]